MTWKAQVSQALGSFNYEIRIAQFGIGSYPEGIHAMLPNGDMAEVDHAVEVEPVLSLPMEAVDALRDALNGHRPPADDADLREALDVERRRVDRILSRREEAA